MWVALEGFDVFNTVSARALRTAVTESFSEVTLEGFELFHCWTASKSVDRLHDRRRLPQKKGDNQKIIFNEKSFSSFQHKKDFT